MTLLLLFAAVLPPASAPGKTDPAVTQANIKQTVCKSGYTKKVRNVTESEKKAVYQRDGKLPKMPECCEVDHLISLELGGSNDPENLWAQPYLPKPAAREKDKVETALKKDVCSGKISLHEAQERIRTDWFAEYQRRFGKKK